MRTVNALRKELQILMQTKRTSRPPVLRRSLPDDWLYFAMILDNVAMTVADGLAYYLEGRDRPMLRSSQYSRSPSQRAGSSR